MQAGLWAPQSARWHSAPQYLVVLHREQTRSDPLLLQRAQTAIGDNLQACTILSKKIQL
jgi:hypothetical protein